MKGPVHQNRAHWSPIILSCKATPWLISELRGPTGLLEKLFQHHQLILNALSQFTTVGRATFGCCEIANELCNSLDVLDGKRLLAP